MRRRNLWSGIVLALAVATGVAACTSTQTSTGITAPSSQKCQLQVSNTPSTFTDAGGSGSLAISTTRDCGWSVTTTANWISMPNTSGQGDASLSYSVAANSVPQTRSATISVEGQTVQLSQAAAPCRYSLSRSGDLIGYQGGSLSVSLTTLTGCGWTTSSDSGWLSIASNASGSASATVGLSVASNSGPQRVGHALIGGQTYTVTQDAAPATPTPDPGPSPSPGPTPSPGPGPTPSPTTNEISGTISFTAGHCPNVTIVVWGQSIVANSSTDYSGGKCNDLKVGAEVTVTTSPLSNGAVTATAIVIRRKA